jgi:hypothetical protein
VDIRARHVFIVLLHATRLLISFLCWYRQHLVGELVRAESPGRDVLCKEMIELLECETLHLRNDEEYPDDGDDRECSPNKALIVSCNLST